MPSGDNRNSRQQPPSSRQDATNRGTGPNDGSSAPSGGDRDVDFGSYVSSTVRSSAELFGTSGRSSRSRRSTPRDDATLAGREESAQSGAPGSRESDTPISTSATTRSRSSRYWRDTVEEDDFGEEMAEPVLATGGGGWRDTINDRFPWAFGDDGRPTLPVLGGIAAIALLLLLAIWLAVQGGGDGTDLNATETPELVIGAPTDGAATEDADRSTPTGFQPVPTQGPDETEETPTATRGGDNQRNRDPNETPGADSTLPLADVDPGPVALACPDRCLIRFSAGGDAERLLSEAQTRASFAADGYYWAIAEPQGIAWIEHNADTTLVSTSAETLHLYITRMPSEETSDDRVASFGTILDSAGDWRLVEVASVPANVRPLTDWGYEVSKVAPAPPGDIATVEEPTDIATIEIGSLIDDVSTSSIESSMIDLIGMGSADGSGIGTRYYTTASNMRAAEYLYQKLESYGLDVWYEDFLTWEGYLVVNVIGEIPGADPSSIYGVMAHFDTIADDTNVSPGADDNATGVAASLEIARILSEYELHHPVRIIFVNVEEVGIVGSEQFAKNAVANNVPYKGIFNLDSVGAQRQYTYVVLNGSSETWWMIDLYKRLNEAYGLNQTINAMTNDAIVADDNRLRDQGIDAIMIGRELYGQSPYHHTSGDTIETVSIPSVAKAGALTLLCLATLAQG